MVLGRISLSGAWRIRHQPMKQRAGSKVTEADFQELEKLVSQEPTPDRAAAEAREAVAESAAH